MRRIRLDMGRLAQALILFGFCVFLIKLFQTGEIHKLVSPTMAVLLLITLGVLIVMTIYAAITVFHAADYCSHAHGHSHHHHEHEHRSGPRKSWIVFLVPVLLGLAVPTQSLGSSMLNSGLYTTQPARPPALIENKQTDPGVSPAVPQQQTAAGSSAASDKVDLSKVPKAEVKGMPLPPKPAPGSRLPLIELESNILLAPEYYFNQRFRFQGLVYHPPGWPDNRLILMRFVMVHCAADTVPLGITVEMKDAAKYPNDTWLEIDGTLSARKWPEIDRVPPVSWYYGYELKPVLIAHSAQKIPEPKDPYEYPPSINLAGGGK
ncbi:TIGR03943 family putative permease subunit [Effusibacillus pohliae]|uniref:TIGR03943 family putative permease subunit n=1 Tax=Effusibacillus pohliae TaxID=232270 RepID=UPI00035DFE30|nr:TIGR03943 family protein [Effusibacillus pohliae]